MLATHWSTQSEDELAQLGAWIRSVWKPGIGRVQENKDYCHERLNFVDIATDAFNAEGIPVARLRTWVNLQQPDLEPGDYDIGYPHVHADETATTLVYYVDPGDKPAPLHIFKGNKVVQEVMPEAGKMVLIPNGVWHGVLKNRGSRDRLAMIATAYPK